MTHSYWSHKRLDALIKLVDDVHGLDLSPFDESFLIKVIAKRAATLVETGVVYGIRLAQDLSEAKTLLQSLHIGYSEFFRNSLAFAMLERLILPDLLEAKEKSGRGEIRIWSAGCATGQEAWSIAILLNELNRARDTSIPYRIIATDWFSPDLDVARTGHYSEDAVGNVRMSHLRRYFIKQKDSFHIASRLMERVDFSNYDLLNDQTSCPPVSIFGNFDLVFCSNVLLYYRPEMQMHILGKIRHCLAPDGYLITDETETGIVEGDSGFRRAAMPAAIFIKECATINGLDGGFFP
jgi:chemotaxis protein methyltransferase CheR